MVAGIETVGQESNRHKSGLSSFFIKKQMIIRRSLEYLFRRLHALSNFDGNGRPPGMSRGHLEIILIVFVESLSL